MCRRTLPLQALRAFEVAARHQSLSKAAEELRITPSAVHHQVRQLSEQLGVELFRRAGRTVVLTQAGAACLPSLERSFDLMTLALEQVRAFAQTGVLRVATCPDFAARWLVRRLDRFHTSFAGIELDLSLTSALPDFGAETTDLAVHYSAADLAHGLRVEPLPADELFPVCSPSLLRTGLVHPDGLAQHLLLHDESRRTDPAYPGWREWLASVGARGVDAARGLRLDSSALVIEMAAAGQGVALARASLVHDELAAGRLTRAYPSALPVPHRYLVVSPPSVADQPKVAAFREWLFAELSRDRVRSEASDLAA